MSKLGAFMNLISFLWQHPDQLLTLLQNLVSVMHVAGQGMEVAGDGAVAASRVFTGGVGVPISAPQTLEAAADAIEEAKQQIRYAADLIDNAADTIGNIQVPTITPSYIDLPIGVQADGTPWRVVSGFTVGGTSAFGGVKTALRGSSDRIDNFGGDLQLTANNVRGLKQALTDAGNNIKDLGDALKQSGQSLQELTE